MAQIVVGLASSHSPHLSTPADGWLARGENDKRNPALIGTDGVVSNYEDLLARADVSRIAKEITPEKMAQRHQRNQEGMGKLSEALYQAKLGGLPREKMNSGNSEIRNWIVVAGATEQFDMDLIDYVPYYRSPAGTGCAMGFAKWR